MVEHPKGQLARLDALAPHPVLHAQAKLDGSFGRDKSSGVIGDSDKTTEEAKCPSC